MSKYKAVTIGELRIFADVVKPPKKEDYEKADLPAALELYEALRVTLNNHKFDKDRFVVHVSTDLLEFLERAKALAETKPEADAESHEHDLPAVAGESFNDAP